MAQGLRVRGEEAGREEVCPSLQHKRGAGSHEGGTPGESQIKKSRLTSIGSFDAGGLVLAEVEGLELSGPRGLHARFLLRALAAAAHQSGSRHVEFGVRSLSLSLPVQPSTVSRVLAELREADDPWLVLVRAG